MHTHKFRLEIKYSLWHDDASEQASVRCRLADASMLCQGTLNHLADKGAALETRRDLALAVAAELSLDIQRQEPV